MLKSHSIAAETINLYYQWCLVAVAELEFVTTVAVVAVVVIAVET